MKRLLTALLLALYLTAATASGGDAGDPLISLSYLEGDFSQTLETVIESRLDASDEVIRQRLTGNTTLKEGDVLNASAGMSFTLLGGEVQVSGGMLVDVTEGREVPSGLLEPNHRYIAAEDAAFKVEAPAAVVSWEGPAVLELSNQPDYYAIARALRSRGLFQGSGSGIGEGFDLYLAPTRGEGLVMFIRLLGEEPDALACTESHPFRDVPAWLDRYVAWAWQKGYSNGVSAGRFDPDQPISAAEYVELLLRALGYSAAGENDYASSLERAADCGLLNEAEYTLLTEKAFRRAHVAYVSYYSLEPSAEIPRLN